MARKAGADWKAPDTIVRSLLAVAVVGFAGWFLVSGAKVDSDFSSRAAVILGIVGTILGYYFGSRGVSQAERQVAAIAEQKGQVVGEVRKIRDDVNATKNALKGAKPSDLPNHLQQVERVERQMNVLLDRHGSEA